VSDYLPGWWVPMMVVWFIAAQVALASGVLAALRAWRLRHVAVMTAADAAILNRRAAVGLVCGAITMTVLPVTHIVVGEPFGPDGNLVTQVVGPALIVLLLAMLPDVLRATRLRPRRDGHAGDLTTDLGTDDPRVTPARLALALSVVIAVVMVVIGIHSDDLEAGILRGLFDAAICLLSFVILGKYLGLRRASPPAPDGSSGTRTRAIFGLGVMVALPLLIALLIGTHSSSSPQRRALNGWSCPVTSRGAHIVMNPQTGRILSVTCNR
jgi:hypothetical protein